MGQGHALKVGDAFDRESLRDLTIVHPKNAYPIEAKKLLVIDFFTTNCGSCIASIPKLNSLQEKYKDKIQILLVTSEKKDRVKNFMEQNRYAKQNRIPIVVEDTILKTLLPYRLVPQIVWILDNRVEGITDGKMLNEEAVNELLKNGRADNWPLKNDFFDERSIIFSEASEYTIFSGVGRYVHGAKTAYLADTLGQQHAKRFRMINVSIIPAFLKAMGEIREMPFMKDQRIILEVEQPDRYEKPKEAVASQWKKQHAFCYEAIWPSDMEDKICYARIIDDLNNKLGIWIRLEERPVKCWVVTKKEDKLPKQRQHSVQPLKIALTLLEINHRAFPPIINDGVPEDYPVALGEVHDLEMLRAELEKDGLTVTEKTVSIECVVLSER
jgi:thiol-disulfide isomerase/thioredoxin